MAGKIAEIFKDGLWTKNPGLVQLLGLCPLLAVTSTATNALGLGLATIAVLTISNVLIAMIRPTVWDSLWYCSASAPSENLSETVRYLPTLISW